MHFQCLQIDVLCARSKHISASLLLRTKLSDTELRHARAPSASVLPPDNQIQGQILLQWASERHLNFWLLMRLSKHHAVNCASLSDGLSSRRVTGAQQPNALQRLDLNPMHSICS
jgi:hypothetical protein